jgi:septum site-determining protein MinD
LEANEIRDIHLIINRLRPDMIARGDMMSVEDVIEILSVDLIGTILDDEQIVVATNQGEPLSGKNSQAEEEYQNICRRLMGEEVAFCTMRPKKGIFKKLGSIFKK